MYGVSGNCLECLSLLVVSTAFYMEFYMEDGGWKSTSLFQSLIEVMLSLLLELLPYASTVLSRY